MIDIRIVCTHEMVHDPQWSTDTLVRFLEAEQHRVRVCYGRQSVDELDAAKSAREAVIVIWSQDAIFSQYMLDWARTINPIRLVEIARAPRFPRINRVAPVIDFTTWRGDRVDAGFGERDHVWGALRERLRMVERDTEPAKPPPMIASVAVGVAGVLAVVGAGVERLTDNGPVVVESIPITAPIVVTESVVTTVESSVPLGGSLDVVEPSSLEDLEPVQRISATRFVPLQLSTSDLVEFESYIQPELPSPSLLDRLSGFNPLRASNENGEEGA